MDATKLIADNVDIVELMEYYSFNITSVEGEFVRAVCSVHGGKNPTSFVASTESGLWFCHAGCGGGDVFTLVELMEELKFIDAVKRLAQIFKIDIANLTIKEREKMHIKELQNWVKVMRDRMRKDEPKEFSFEGDAKKITKLRSFTQETLEKFNVLFVSEFECDKKDGGKYVLYDRIMIPIHNKHGVQVGVSLRRTKSADVPKWSHQPRTLKVGDMLYNYDRVIDKEIIVITEGLFDVWAFEEIGVPSVATYGASISDEQYRMLMRTSADLVFAFDGDKAGRECLNKALRRFHNKANLAYIAFDDGEDCENITREELLKRYEQRSKG